jgi:hypothetical protein
MRTRTKPGTKRARGASAGKAGRSPRQTKGAPDAATNERQVALDLLREKHVDPDGATAEQLWMNYATRVWQAEQKRSTKLAIEYLNTILCKESLPKDSLARASLERCKAENERALANIKLVISDKKAAGGRMNMPLFWACADAIAVDWSSEVLATVLWLKGGENGDWEVFKHRVSVYWSDHFAKIAEDVRAARP